MGCIEELDVDCIGWKVGRTVGEVETDGRALVVRWRGRLGWGAWRTWKIEAIALVVWMMPKLCLMMRRWFLSDDVLMRSDG